MPHPLFPDDPDWADDAACRTPAGAGVNFFPSDSDIGPAQAVCAVCPVQVECLDYALATNQQHGIWGGASERERRRIRRHQLRARQETPNDA